MDPKPSSSGVLLAPAHSGSSAALRLPSANEFPSLDQHLVQPETRDEIIRGRRVVALPAHPPHADRHFGLDYVIGAHIKEGYVGSTDLLTRAATASNFATDTCVRRAGIDPKTDTRYLEELAFELVNEQTLRDVSEKAEDLSARGVRRVLAIFVKRGEVWEWSAKAGEWMRLDPEGTFTDRTLARPLSIKALLHAAEADNAVAQALVAKGNPVLMQMIAQGEKKGLLEGEKKGLLEGEKQGLRTAIESACASFAIELTEEKRAQISELDPAGLKALLTSIYAERRLP